MSPSGIISICTQAIPLLQTAGVLRVLFDVSFVYNKKLSCRREAARCVVFVSSQLQHTYSAVFLLLVTAASDLLVHKSLLNSVLLSPIVSGGARPLPPDKHP